MKKKVLFLIILLVIGFASISTTLVINGVIGIGANKDDFNVIFTEALLDDDSTNVTISENKKNISFTTKMLTTIGDSTILNYKVKNTSTQYDANVSINCTNNAEEYVEITSSFDGKTIPLAEAVKMSAQEVKSGYINAKLTKAYVGEDKEIKITCSLVVNAESKEGYSYTVNFDSDGGSSIEDKIVNYQETYGELPTPEKEGYVFLGWYDENDKKIESKTEIKDKGNKTLHAKWTPVCPYEVGKTWEFNYTGGEQTFESPCLANYKIEVWGAQGGASNEEYVGGYGGYASGVTTFDYHTNAYVNVGGKGETNSTPGSTTGANGGYNGGGTSYPNSGVNHLYGAGGGATHIALKSGLLSTLGNNIDQILIVAGGGGGGRWQQNWEGNDLAYYGYGGHGGGVNGGYGTDKSNPNVTGGGTQSGTLSGGRSIGTFGKGADYTGQGAGGGGFYGGNAFPTGGGGSGYIGNTLLTNKVMYCYNCTESNEESTKTISTTNVDETAISTYAKTGDGYARITLLSLPY